MRRCWPCHTKTTGAAERLDDHRVLILDRSLAGRGAREHDHRQGHGQRGQREQFAFEIHVSQSSFTTTTTTSRIGAPCLESVSTPPPPSRTQSSVLPDRPQNCCLAALVLKRQNRAGHEVPV